MKELYYKNREHFLSQKFAAPFKAILTNHSLLEIDSIIKIFNKNYIRNIKKEMIVKLLKYNVDGSWVKRLTESKKFGKDGFSLASLQHRYGDLIGKQIFEEQNKKITARNQNYTVEQKEIISKRKISNLGLDGYIKKYGKEEGKIKWEKYLKNWKLGIEKRKQKGKWKNGRTLPEFQSKWGVEDGYKRWRASYDKRNHTLSLIGFIERFGSIEGVEKYYNHIEKMVSNCRGKSNPYSKISQELFNNITSKLVSKQKELVKYFTYNKEQSFFANGKYGLNLIYVDFKCGNAIIEFDGSYWHSFPSIIEKDKRRDLFLISLGYKILRIPEEEYLKNKEKVIKKCIRFVNKYYERT